MVFTSEYLSNDKTKIIAAKYKKEMHWFMPVSLFFVDSAIGIDSAPCLNSVIYRNDIIITSVT